jgi:hypothetical protein
MINIPLVFKEPSAVRTNLRAAQPSQSKGCSTFQELAFKSGLVQEPRQAPGKDIQSNFEFLTINESNHVF